MLQDVSVSMQWISGPISQETGRYKQTKVLSDKYIMLNTRYICYAQSVDLRKPGIVLRKPAGLSCANPGSMFCLRNLEIALIYILTQSTHVFRNVQLNEGTKVVSTTPEPGRAVERTHR